MQKPALPPDLEDFLRSSGFRDPAAARRRLHDLFRDAAEMIGLARLSGFLKDLVRECPDPDAALLQLARFVEVRGSRLQLYRTFLDHPALLDRFVRVVSSSRYLADILIRNPEYLEVLSDATRLARPRPLSELTVEMTRLVRSLPSETAKLDALRRLHRREVLRIGAADLLGFLDVPAITRQISDLADAFVAQCLATVTDKSERTGLIVLGVGKWGGRELNYSSDIDVIFLATKAAQVPGATRVAQRLIRVLSEPTSEGVVYRVDLRLRPYGPEGTLVTTPAMFEDYLRTKSQPAERQMMLKARVSAGERPPGERFLRRIVPILLKDGPTARRQVRRLKFRIEKQLHERGQTEGHVKLAPGGIRDVEFLVQAIQLEAGIRGGNTLEALGKLQSGALVASHDAEILREAYAFLRAVEHHLQLMENQQVYRLPSKPEDLERLARTVGLRGPDARHGLLDAYDTRTRKVRAIFDRVLGAPEKAPSPASRTDETFLRQLGPAADRLDVDQIQRCSRLLQQIRGSGDVAVHAQQNDPLRWTIAVGAGNPPGILALIAGLLTARGASIVSGDFMKLRLSSRRMTLAVFEVLLPKKVSAGSWKAFRDRLAGLLALAEEEAQEALFEEVAGTLRPASGPDVPLLPVRIETRNESGELHLHSTDTLGFLFEFATALGALKVDVDRAVIRTLEDEVYDTFWIAGGRSLDEVRVAAALVKQFMHLLPRAPNPSQALRQFTLLLRQMCDRPEWVPELRNLESTSVLSTIAELMGVSRFLWEDFLLVQHENLFPVMVDVPALDRRPRKAQMERELARSLRRARDFEDAFVRLNEFKDREMFRIELRHITRRSEYREFMASLSDLAEAVLGRAAGACLERKGPVPGPWSIGGLGKFGGRELGLASDLDLIVVYEGDEAAAAYFSDFVKSLVQSLTARREGSFGIDLRLRPWGSAGALASSLDGFRQYYSEEGPARNFERLSLVKLNPAAGDPALGAALLKARDEFVYSAKPVDYENIRHLRGRQAAELVPSGEISAKYSPGGVVDVEYFVQSQQIEAGRRDSGVRGANTLEAIDRLVRGGHLRERLGAELAETYVFLRRLIDALRVVRGSAQESKIPAVPLREFAYLVRRLEYGTPARLEAEIRQRMSFARNVWNEVRG